MGELLDVSVSDPSNDASSAIISSELTRRILIEKLSSTKIEHRVFKRYTKNIEREASSPLAANRFERAKENKLKLDIFLEEEIVLDLN